LKLLKVGKSRMYVEKRRRKREMGVYMWSCESVKVQGKDECRRNMELRKSEGKMFVLFGGDL